MIADENTQAIHRQEGVYAKLAYTLKSFDAICNGEADDLPEQAFLYVGAVDDGRARAKEMAK